jgi:chemotaxis protein MotB
MVRKPAYLNAERAGRERWLISYTDILTLLLILFIAIAAQAVGQQQARAIQSTASAAVATAPAGQTAEAAATAAANPITPASPMPQVAPAAPGMPALPPAPAAPSSTAAVPPTTSREALVRAEERLKKTGLDLHLEARGLIISLPQAILFGSGDARINRSAQPIIAEIADVLRSLDNKVELAGHADSVPIHTARFKNNWELSAARGLALLKTLTEDYGIAESRLTVSSHGSYSPKSSNETPDGRAENRRVEILILDEEVNK